MVRRRQPVVGGLDLLIGRTTVDLEQLVVIPVRIFRVLDSHHTPPALLLNLIYRLEPKRDSHQPDSETQTFEAFDHALARDRFAPGLEAVDQGRDLLVHGPHQRHIGNRIVEHLLDSVDAGVKRAPELLELVHVVAASAVEDEFPVVLHVEEVVVHHLALEPSRLGADEDFLDFIVGPGRAEYLEVAVLENGSEEADVAALRKPGLVNLPLESLLLVRV
mmetsp:Transcript_11962/g.21822  ORF Transcript_11962/g.21822 Transcript_11962/m.21822 type:complete len:219 (-) Transcript_11962:703-1359(-)